MAEPNAEAQTCIPVLALIALTLLGCGRSAYTGPVSDHFDGYHFHDDPPVEQVGLGSVLRWLLTADALAWPAHQVFPAGAGPSVPPAHAGTDEVRVTFVNHSTMLVQMGDLNVLTDPVWSARVGPTSWLGPARHHDPGVRFDDLPHVDVVVISHDHYDHLDLPTLKRLQARDAPLIIAGLGTGRLLGQAKLAPYVELDWWGCHVLGANRICALPAQHNSRRGVFDGGETLWASYWIQSPSGTVYFAGDTGFGPHFARIRDRLGSPCVALLPIGAYKPRWFMRGNHMDPHEAVEALDVLGSRQGIAMHFGTFEQSDEGMYEPAGELGLALADGRHARFTVPAFGEQSSVRCRPALRSAP